MAPVQGTLALDLLPRHDPPEVRLTSRPGGVQANVADIPRDDHREFERFCGRILQAVVEIVGGDRPVSQLIRWTTTTVHQDLARRALLVARTVDRRPGEGGIQAVRPQVIGVHACFVSPRVAEVSAHVRYGRRSRAVAARFERRRDRWLCTALEFA